MAFGPDSIFATLKARMQVLSTRERVVAENIANANTPGFTPKDVNLDGFESALRAARRGGNSAAHGGGLARTHAGHIAAPQNAAGNLLQIRDTPDSETTIDGNRVVVEEQMLKLSDTRGQYEQAASLYRTGLQFLRTAARTPR